HKVAVYRTVGDPEHAPDHKNLWQRCAMAILTATLAPLIFTTRWLILGPASLFSPRLRAWVMRRATAITTNPSYVATPLKPAMLRQTRIVEAICFVWCATLLTLTVLGIIPWQSVLAGAIALSIATGITDLRGEILHRFSNEGSWGTLERQVRDSVN